MATTTNARSAPASASAKGKSAPASNPTTSNPQGLDENPFKPADNEGASGRLKIFAYGDTGAGKTSLALEFPSPTVIDTEGGTDPYSTVKSFHRIRTSDPAEIWRSVSWLRKNHHEYRTLVLDPITVYWEALQRVWTERLHRHRADSNHGQYGEFYELQTRDWALIKNDLRAFFRLLLSLDMNIVVTAREKDQYASGGGEMMKKIGVTFDAERSTAYHFDIVLHLKYDEPSEKFVAFIRKARGVFALKLLKIAPNRQIIGDSPRAIYEAMARACGVAAIEAAAKPVELVTTEQAMEIDILAKDLGLNDAQIAQRIREKYGAERIDDLTVEAAGEILEKLREKAFPKGSAAPDARFVD